MKSSKQKFEWHMVPSVLFVLMLLVCFVWSVCHGISEAMLNASTSSSAVYDEGDADQ